LANFGKPWSPGEDKALTAEFDAGTPNIAIAAKHQRTLSSVCLRLEKLENIDKSAAA